MPAVPGAGGATNGPIADYNESARCASPLHADGYVHRPHPWQSSTTAASDKTWHRYCRWAFQRRREPKNSSIHLATSRIGAGMTRQYTVIYESGPNNWSAYVPDLPGCIATGATRDEIEHASFRKQSNSISKACDCTVSKCPSRRPKLEQYLSPSNLRAFVPELSASSVPGDWLEQTLNRVYFRSTSV